MEQQLENQILALVQDPLMARGLTNPQMLDNAMFAESERLRYQTQNGMGMPNLSSITKINDGNVLVIALGVIMSQTVGGFLSGFLAQVGKYASILAGLALAYFGKNKKLIRDFGIGVMIGGIASAFGGLGSALTGAFQEHMPGYNKDNQFEEQVKDTYGGTDGIYPSQPDRRTMA